MRNLNVPEAPLEQWSTRSEPGSIAMPLHHGNDGSGAHRRVLSAPRIDEQRVADLAQEILASAIRLVAMLKVAQQVASAQSKANMAAAGGPDNA